MFFYQLKSELWKLFGKKRTYIGFGMFLVAQLAIILMFRYTNARHWILNSVRRSGFDSSKYLSMLTIASVMVALLAQTILSLYVALVGGDLVSKEAEDGTLRMILSRPISRVRLLCLKWLAGCIFSCFLVFALGMFGLLFSAIWFPPGGGLFVLIPEEGVSVFDMATGMQHYLMVLGFITVKAIAMMSLAFMFSCFNMKPAAATILALSLVLIDHILMEIPYFHDLKQYFLSHYINSWQFLFLEHVPWWRVGEGLSVTLGFGLTSLIIGIMVFQARDIKS
jgi:ABC-2 type transport system permease protein